MSTSGPVSNNMSATTGDPLYQQQIGFLNPSPTTITATTANTISWPNIPTPTQQVIASSVFGVGLHYEPKRILNMCWACKVEFSNKPIFIQLHYKGVGNIAILFFCCKKCAISYMKENTIKLAARAVLELE